MRRTSSFSTSTREGVVDRLPGDRADLGANRLGDVVRRAVRPPDTAGSTARRWAVTGQAVIAENVCEVLGHGDRISPNLDTVKNR